MVDLVSDTEDVEDVVAVAKETDDAMNVGPELVCDKTACGENTETLIISFNFPAGALRPSNSLIVVSQYLKSAINTKCERPW